VRQPNFTARFGRAAVTWYILLLYVLCCNVGGLWVLFLLINCLIDISNFCLDDLPFLVNIGEHKTIVQRLQVNTNRTRAKDVLLNIDRTQAAVSVHSRHPVTPQL